MNSGTSAPSEANGDALWVSMPILRNIVLGAAGNAQGIAAICGAAELEPSDLDRADLRIDLARNCALMDAALDVSGDRWLGLHVGQRTSATVLGLTGHLMESSPDLLGALHSMQDYTRAFTRLYTFTLEVKGDEVHYGCEPIQVWNDVSPETARHSVDIGYAGLLRVFHLLAGRPVRPLRVLYRYLRLPDLSEHERVLGCRPMFGAGSNTIVFSLADLRAPVVGYNPGLNAMLKDLLEGELRRQAGDAPFIEQVRQTVLRNLQVTFPPLEAVADALHMTPRTLQRRLKEVGTTYRELGEAIKEEIARNLLRNPDLTLTEIALRLGYAEVTSFHRAFRQWTGMTPNEFRESL